MVSPTKNVHYILYPMLGVHKKRNSLISEFLGECRGTVTRTQDPLVPNQMR